MAGFSVTFPLGPAIQDYYIIQEHYTWGWLGSLLPFLESWSVAGVARPEFYVSVLFGGLVAGLYSFVQFLCSPIFGRLSDRIGRRPLLVGTAIGMLLSYLMWCFAGTFELFLLSRILGGMMSASFVVAGAATADLSPGKERSKGMAVIGMAFGLGILVGPALGGLAALWDLSEVAAVFNPMSFPALVAAGLSLLNLACLLRFLKETLPLEERRMHPLKLRDFLGFLRTENNVIQGLSSANFFYLFAFSGMESSLSFLAAERMGFGPKQMGMLFLLIGMVSVVTQGVFVRRWAPRLGEATVCLSGLATCIVGLWAQALAWNAFTLAVSTVIIAIAAGLTFPMFPSLVAKYSSPDRRGENIGAIRSMGSLGRVLGPLVAAYFYFTKGAYFLYCTQALVCVIPLFLVGYVTRRTYKISPLKA